MDLMGDINSVVAGGGGGGSPDPQVDRISPTVLDDLAAGGNINGNSINMATDRVAITSDGAYLLFGDPGYDTGGGNSGRALLYKRTASSPTWSLLTTFLPVSGTSFWWGNGVSISDNLRVAAVDQNGLFTYFLPTGTDTWDGGTETTLSGGFSRFVKLSSSGAFLVVENSPSAEAWRFDGAAFVFEQDFGAGGSAAGGETVGSTAYINHAAVVAPSNDEPLAFVLWNIDPSGTSNDKNLIDVWRWDSTSPWVLQQTVLCGLGDGALGGGATGGDFDGGDKLAVSADGRVLAVGNAAVYRGSTYVGGIYIFQAPGDYTINGGLSTFVQTALITGNNGAESNSGFGKAVALSKDGTFLVVGSNYHDSGGSDAGGAAVAINRVSELVGEHDLGALVGAIALSNPHPPPTPGEEWQFGQAVAMDYNGRTVVVIGEDSNDLGYDQVRVFDFSLDGLANDRFSEAVVLNGTVPQTDTVVGPYNTRAAGLEPLEFVPIGGTYPDYFWEGRSVWFSLTPTSNCTLQLDTYLSASTSADFVDLFDAIDPTSAYADTIISVGQATAADAFTPESGGENDDTSESVSSGPPDLGTLSKLDTPINLISGTTYYIRVGLYQSSDAVFFKLRYTLT